MAARKSDDIKVKFWRLFFTLTMGFTVVILTIGFQNCGQISLHPNATPNNSVTPSVVCDGQTDNYDVLSKAAATAGLNGNDLQLPPGLCLLNMSGRTSIQLTSGLWGASFGTATGPSAGNTVGTVLLIRGASASPFILSWGASIRNINFQWPDQIDPQAPNQYPPAIVIDSASDVVIHNVTMVNAYIGIEVVGSSGFFYITDNRISAFKSAVKIGPIRAESWITGNNFSHAWGYDFYAKRNNVAAWKDYYAKNAIGLDFTAPNSSVLIYWDAVQLKNNVFMALQTGLKISHSGSDALFWGNVTSNTFDGCENSIAFFGGAIPNQMAITGNTFASQDPGRLASTAILFQMGVASGSPVPFAVNISGNQFSCQKGPHINLSAQNGRLGDISITGNNLYCHGWGLTGARTDSIILNASNLVATVTGNTFNGSGGQSADKSGGISALSFDQFSASGNAFTNMNFPITIGSGLTAAITGNTSSNPAYGVTGTASNQINANNSWNH